MNRQRRFTRMARHVFVAALLLAGVGCEHAMSPYRGPQPAPVGLASEAVTVRYVWPPVLGQHSFTVDRDRYVQAGDPHNVNRVVELSTTPATVDAVTALDLQPGDRIIVSSEFSGIREVGELRQIPDWPGHRYSEYPIGVHLISAVTRAP